MLQAYSQRIRKRPLRFRRRVIVLAILTGICGVGVFSFGVFVPVQFVLEDPTEFVVVRGQGAAEIADGLYGAGIIRSPFLFRSYVLMRGVARQLQAGSYDVHSGMSIADIALQFAKGSIKKQTITILEGWNTRDIAADLEARGIASQAIFFELVGPPPDRVSHEFPSTPARNLAAEFDFLKDKPESAGLEGYLFPETYEHIPADGVGPLVRTMLQEFDANLKPEWREEIAKQGKTIFEIVTMASLLEREVPTLQDKKIVAGLLWKRLEAGIPLQVDATIVYLTGKKSVSRSDTKIESPYNTYHVTGLPKGPIANPGSESIKAAIYPEESPYWYYLSARTGTTIFSRTLAEHNVAKARYLR